MRQYKVIGQGLSYDDVLIVPNRSNVLSRKDVCLKTKLTAKIKLNIPIVSANMDTVTESATAIAMAREGGIGLIHRFMSIEEQVKEVLKVKRSETIMIENPYSIKKDNTLKDAFDMMNKCGVHGLLVVEDGNKLVGILTSRDILFETDMRKKVEDLMTKRQNLVTAPPFISIEKAKSILKQHKIEKLPLIDENNRVFGLITLKDVIKKEKFPCAAYDKKGRLLVGAAIGVKGDFLQRARALLDAGCDVIVIDIAHGHSENVIRTAKTIKNELGDVQLVGGNIATAEGTRDLIDAGCDGVKIGVGPGSICTTRIITGAGVPQITAIMDCAKISEETGVPLIADGGIKQPGDITKAIGAGASTIMCGNMLAGTEESPGFFVIRGGKKYKVYRGMASFGASMGRQEREKKYIDEKLLCDFVPEGVEATLPYRGNISEVIHQLLGGLRSGMSYCGASTIDELKHKCRFIKISAAGMRESKAHDVNKV